MRSAHMAELGEIGAGVGLFPNNMRILRQPSVVDSVTRRAAPINEWWMLAPGGSVGVNDHHRGANLVSAQGEPE